MSRPDSAIHEALLEDLSDGVLAVDFEGTVLIANTAFCEMFGLDSTGTVGYRFGEVFLSSEGTDDFTQAVFDAVARRDTGKKQIVSVRVGDRLRSLAVTTSYLTTADEERIAVIAVVADITDIKELRESELRMAKTIENQLGELQSAYRDLEAQNETLSSLTRRVRTTRITSVALIVGFFVVLGAGRIQSLDLFGTEAGPGTASGALSEEVPDSLSTITVALSELRSTIALRGVLAPGVVMDVVSPLEGHVRTAHAIPGQRVEQGAPLVSFDVGQLSVERRRAEVEYIQARDALAEIEQWDNGAEMARARRTLRRARIALEDAEQRFSRAEFLLEQGIVPSSEQEEARRSRENRRLDLEEAERELEPVRAKGGEQAQQVAQLELETAESNLRDQLAKLDQATIRAPLAGIVVEANDPDGKPLTAGRPVTQGELLLSIADFERLAVVTHVDEVDVRKIEVGQAASVTGPGFPGPPIRGTVSSVSSSADDDYQQQNAPRFEVMVELDRVSESARDRLRVGMTAYVQILIQSRPEALLIPLSAVEQDGEANWVRVLDPDTGAVERRNVALGLTTLDSVEVTSGLAAGEEIIAPE